MKELVVISGKGGTGKTSIVASFAAFAKNSNDWKPVFIDCDVDAADLHLILNPKILEKHDFYSGKSASIIKEKCIQCGKCIELCKFDAIDENFSVNKFKCEGCGVCVRFCPANAISFNENLCGEWYVSDTRFGRFVHAKLGIAEENSGKLVTKIRNHARLVANQEKADLIIADGSPGIGCPVIASVSGANFVAIVTEPTFSGLHDLERVYELTKHFKIKCGVCVNKHDINEEMTKIIENYCRKNDILFLGRVSYSKDFNKAQINRLSIVEYSKNQPKSEIKEIWNKISNILKEE